MPKPFNKLTAIAAPIMRGNIDTDVIIRIERLVGNSVRGTLGKWAFGALRYLPDGSDNPEFILNREPYRQAEILVTGPNFGCGSSREGAVWSLQELGIRAVIGSSFGDIFFANCFQNGILPIVVDKQTVDNLAAEIEATQGAGQVSHRSRGADHHDAGRQDAPLRDRSAPARRAAAGARRGDADPAARPRNPGVPGSRSHRAAMDPFCKEIGMNNRSNMVKVAVVGGEGIGPEVTAQSQRVLNWFAAKRGVPMTLREAQYGIVPYLATGKVLPDDTVEAMEECDAILWGATGGPETKEVPAAARKAGSLLGLRSKYDLYANLRPDRRPSGAVGFGAAEGACARGRRFRHHPRADQRHLFRRAARHRDAARRAASRLQHRAIHHEPGPPRGAVGLRAGAHAPQQGLLGGQGQCARDQRALARGGDQAASGGVLRCRADPSLCRQCRHADRARSRAVRRDGDRQHLWRHPVRLRGDGVGLARHAAVGVARPGGQVRSPQGAVRAGAWQCARYRGQGHCQSARLDPERRHDAANDDEPA